MRNVMAALAALLVALPASATVTGTTTSISYTCTGGTIYTIPFSYLAASQVVATQTTAAGVVTTVIGTVKPSIAPTIGTITLGTACPSGSTLILSRVVPLTQLQSFRTGSYSGATHEQTFDRLAMQIQQLNAKEVADIGVVNNTVAAFNASGAAIGSTTSVLSTGSTTPRTLAARFADVINLKDFNAKGDGVTDDTAAIQAAINAAPSGSTIVGTNGSTYQVNATGLLITGKTNVTLDGRGAKLRLSAVTSTQTMTGAAQVVAIKIASNTGLVMRGWVIDGGAFNTTTVGFDGCTECEFSDNRVSNGASTLAQVMSVGGTRNRFLRNVVYGGTSTARGMWIGNTFSNTIETNALIEGNTVYGNNASGIVITSNSGRVANNYSSDNNGSGIVVPGANGFPTHGITITGNTCARNTFHGIQADMSTTTAADSAYDIVVTGNNLEANNGSGIYAVNGTRWTITGNLSRNNNVGATSGHGIQIDRLSGGSVTGNICYDSRVGGARTQTIGISGTAQVGANDITDVTISGNLVYNNVTHGIAIQSTGSGTVAGVSISNNILETNGGSGLFIAESTVGTVTRLAISGNVSRGNTTSDLRIDPLDAALLTNTNSFTTTSGTQGAIFGFPDLGTTPSVAGRYLFKAANTGATTITNFTNGTLGQSIRVWFSNANTTIASGGSLLTATGNVTPTGNSFMDFTLTPGNVWMETARSIRGASGTITLVAGTGTATVFAGARCSCVDSSAAAAVRCSVATNTLTALGTGTDLITYTCQ